VLKYDEKTSRSDRKTLDVVLEFGGSRGTKTVRISKQFYIFKVCKSARSDIFDILISKPLEVQVG
jgi:hypothetical protein